MALKLYGYYETTIKTFGRWTSLAFLQYIHNEIAHISRGVSVSRLLHAHEYSRTR